LWIFTLVLLAGALSVAPLMAAQAAANGKGSDFLAVIDADPQSVAT
jgi:hypothetical protein